MYIPLWVVLLVCSWLWFREWDTPAARQDRQRVRAVWRRLRTERKAADRATRHHWRAVHGLAMGLAWEHGVGTWLRCGLSVGWTTLRTVSPHDTMAVYHCQIPLYVAWIAHLMGSEPEKALEHASVGAPARPGH
jgi:hypothetical protein